MTAGRLHSLAWLAWLAAALIVLTLTRNPLYLAMILLWIALVSAALRRFAAASETPIPLSPFRFGLIVVPLSALFNALTVHAGSTVLFELPEELPFFGGPVTAEALVYGALSGLVISGLYAAFVVLQRALPVRSLLRLIPRAFYPVALITTIAVTFVPVTLRQLQQIREAQAVRGHRMAGLRDWLPLFLPLLTSGLERSLHLAEAMMARGFAGGEEIEQDQFTRGGLLLGLLLVAAGWLLRMVWHADVPGLALLLAGVTLIGALLRRAGRRHPHTVYRPQPWRRRDGFVLAGALLTAVAFLIPLPGIDRSTIFYSPYPTLAPPAFSPLLGLATWGLLVPVAALAGSEDRPLARSLVHIGGAPQAPTAGGARAQAGTEPRPQEAVQNEPLP